MNKIRANSKVTAQEGDFSNFHT